MVTYIPLFWVYICNHFVEVIINNSISYFLFLLHLLPTFVGEVGPHEDEGY